MYILHIAYTGTSDNDIEVFSTLELARGYKEKLLLDYPELSEHVWITQCKSDPVYGS